jgi:hypothetical protein
MSTTMALGRRKAPKPRPTTSKGNPSSTWQRPCCTAFFADGQGEDESEDDDDNADPDGDVPEDATATATGNDPMAKKKKKISKRTTGYKAKEDVFLCRSWLAISQDAIFGVEQKGKAYWKRVTVDYHERR